MPAPARADAVRRRPRAARHGSPLHGRRVRRSDQGASGGGTSRERDHRRDRRLPHRGRHGIPPHAGRDRRRRHHPRPRVLLLAAPRHRRRRARRPSVARGEEAAVPRASRPRRGAFPPPPHRQARARRAGADRQGREHPMLGLHGGLHALLSAGRCGTRGELVDVICAELYADGIACDPTPSTGLSSMV